MSEIYVVSGNDSRPKVLQGLTDRNKAAAALEESVRHNYTGVTPLGDPRGNKAVLAFVEGKANAVTWGKYRLDAYQQENK